LEIEAKKNRRSLRLAGYNYGRPGGYFVTICIQGRECLLGEIIDGKMHLNQPGQMIEKWWTELKQKFPAIEIDEFMVLPNHLHGVLMILPNPKFYNNVGAALCGRPNKGHPHRGAPTLGDIMDWFKTMTTNEYIRSVKTCGWPSFQGRFWQRNYYEHVIRNEEELEKIREYIVFNPMKWPTDRDNPEIAVPDRKDEMEIILESRGDPAGRPPCQKGR
jgi:putative transposase